MTTVHEAHSGLTQEAANSQGLMSVTAAKAKKEDKDKIKLTDLIDKSKATKEERDVDIDEVGAELMLDEHGNVVLKTDEAEIYAELALRHEDTGADNDQVFLIDGDSLLHEILLDPLLDWTHGGQFLHIVYALEQYVKRFQEGGRIFRFVFFHCFGSVAWANQPLIQLVRERVIHHLRALKLQANEFENWWDPEFAQFLERVDPAFVLVGDGSGVSSSASSSSTSAPAGPDSLAALTGYMSQLSLNGAAASPSLPAHAVIRSLSLYLLSHHFRVIRLTELSFAANAMLGFQLAMAQAYKRQLREAGGYKPDEKLRAKAATEDKEGSPLYRIQAAKAFDANLASSLATVDSLKADVRLAATAYALTQLLKSADVAKLAETSGMSAVDFSRSVLISAFLTRHLALDARALVWEAADEKKRLEAGLAYAPLLAAFHQHLLVAAIGGQSKDAVPTAPELDAFDGRLLAFVLYALKDQKVPTLGWSASMEKDLLAAWEAVRKETKAAAFLPFHSLKSLAAAGVTDLDEATLLKEAHEKFAKAQAAVAVTKAAAASASGAKAAAVEEESSGNWDDEDDEPAAAKPVAKPAAKVEEEEEDVGSWEDISDEEEEAKVEVAAPVAVVAAPAATTVLPPAATALVPITGLDNKFVKDISGVLDAHLAQHGLLLQPESAAQPLTSFAARYAVTADKQLDDGMDEAAKPIVPTNKREQRFASRIVNYWEQYSKSLVGGRLVLREVVVASASKDAEDEEEEESKSGKGGKKPHHAKEAKEKKAGGGKPGAGGGKKPGAKGVEKESIKDKIRREVEETQRLKVQAKLQGKINIAASMSTLPAKIAKLDSELEQVSDASAVVALLQLLEWCMELWKQSKPKSEIEPAIKVFVLIHDIYRRFRQFLTAEEFKKIALGLIQIGFEDVAHRMSREFAAASEGRFTADQCKVEAKSSTFPGTLIGLSYNRFQLEYAGPWMLRNVDSAPDDRVTKFYPDKWQRDLLDVADAQQSALIVAPTSAGKTFISYYVMKNVLSANKTIERSSERGVVVYVSPNKALVNQVSADVYQRYGLVFGTATDDHCDKALTSEVLITVPSVLEKLLLNPTRQAWVSKIRWVIFDEVHLISSAGEGSIWERCLSLIRCPFLALSATVGNPHDFHGWLSRLDAMRGRSVHLIVHETRWSDLEKQMYLPSDPSVPPHNPEGNPKFDLRTNTLLPSQCASVRVHPCAAVGAQFAESTDFPKEISFSPRDSLSLYDALIKHVATVPVGPLKTELAALAPEAFFPEMLISKARAMEYEARLKRTLTAWLEAGLIKEVGAVMSALTGDLRDRIARMESLAKVGQSCYDVSFIRKHFFSLLLEMYARDQLPGIIFSNDSELCVQLVTDTLEKLEELESRTLELESSNEDSKAKIKQKAQLLKALKKKRDQKKKNKQAEEEAKEADELDIEVEADSEEYTVDPRFSFIDETEKMDKKEMEYWVKRTLYKTQWKKSHPLIRALYRGIGVHHGGLVKQYRDLVETLFRGKHLKVVVATSTLALGVNMPARSVTLCGDSKLLTPLQYRQMSGRAGRRGYDNIGHVVFFAVPPRKIFRLLKSPLNSLRGHFPITSTLSLRMIDYYSLAGDKKDAAGALTPLLKEPFFADNWSGSKLQAQISYQFRFSLDAMHKQALITAKGQGYGLASLATYLHAADPSNFGFVALLQCGHLHSICKNYETDKNRVARELLTLLAHLFYRVPVPAYLTRANFRANSHNLVLLPPVDPQVKKIIGEYNKETMTEYTNFLKAFAWGLLKNWSLLLGNITTALRTLSSEPTTDVLVKSFDHLSTTFGSYFDGIINI